MHEPDVLICGAGPAGCALAGLLAREGVDALLLDAEPEPSDRVGESLLPFGNRVLERLGVSMEGFLPKRGAVFTRGDDSTRIDFSEAARPRWPSAHQVGRAAFDARMRAAALAAGARIEFARVQQIAPFLARTELGEVRAGLVVDAMGREGALARAMGVRKQHPILRNAARSTWYRGVRRLAPEQEGDIVIATFEGGWFWIIPLGTGPDAITSVGAVTTPDSGIKGGFEAAIERCDAVRRRLDGAVATAPLRGIQDFSWVAERFFGEGWALCGDAAVFVDPVFSSGVLLGLESASGLADAILGRQTFEDWQASVLRASTAFEQVVLSFYDRSFLRVLFAEQQQPQVRAEIVALLAGDVMNDDAPRRIAARIGELGRRLERQS